MAKTVTDAALLLGALVGHDPNDAGARSFPDGTPRLLPDPANTSLAGRRIGVLRTFRGAGSHADVEQVFAAAVETLRRLGATIVDPIEITRDRSIGVAVRQTLLWEFKAGLNRYLASHPVPDDRDTLAEIITYNERHRARVMPSFGQELFYEAEAMSGLDDPAYQLALAAGRDRARSDLDAVFAEHGLDALVAPTNGPAWKTDWLNGDRFSVSSSGFPATSGYPNVTVPTGYVSGLPVGLSFIGLAFSEPTLIQIAYAFELATGVRIEPMYRPTLDPD